MPKPYPKKGMPPKKAKKPLKRSAIKKKYVKGNNDNSKGCIGSVKKPTKKQSKPSGEDKPIARKTPITRRRKSTGEAKIFKEIWSERPHFCQVTGLYLGEELDVRFMSHVMPKSIAPELRLDKRNIWIVHPDMHYEWDHGNRNLPVFTEKRKLFEQLKIEINNR